MRKACLIFLLYPAVGEPAYGADVRFRIPGCLRLGNLLRGLFAARPGALLRPGGRLTGLRDSVPGVLLHRCILRFFHRDFRHGCGPRLPGIPIAFPGF